MISKFIFVDLNNIIKLNLLSEFYSFWKDLDDLSRNKELQKLKEHYQTHYLSICWRGYAQLAIISILLQILFILLFQNQQSDRSLIIFPLMALFVGMIADHIISKNTKRIEFIFLFFTILNGIMVTHEGLQYKEYRFHETWLLFYSMYLIISIATCFRWKKMIIVFTVVQIYNIIQIHINYSDVSSYFYMGYMVATLLIPLVWMIVARILLGFIQLQHNNQQLINTIKKILQVFPEGIIIQSLDENTKELIVKFVNYEAQKEIVKNEYSLGKPIDNSKLNIEIKESKYSNPWNSQGIENQASQQISLYEYLLYQTEIIQKDHNDNDERSIEIWDNSNYEDDDTCK